MSAPHKDDQEDYEEDEEDDQEGEDQGSEEQEGSDEYSDGPGLKALVGDDLVSELFCSFDHSNLVGL